MRTLRKKYKNPRRPWDTDRIGEEKKLLKEFGLRRKREIWKAQAIVREFRRRARNLIANKDEEETKILLEKLVKLGLLERGQGLDHVLSLDVGNVLNRRLQTIVHKKGFASTAMQARQKITHGHVIIGGRKVLFPSYLVPVDRENLIRIKAEKVAK